MILLTATLSTGTLIGMAIGSVLAYPRGHRDGVQAGLAQARQNEQAWQRLLDSTPGYAQQLRHGSPGHSCSAKCKPRKV